MKKRLSIIAAVALFVGLGPIANLAAARTPGSLNGTVYVDINDNGL